MRRQTNPRNHLFVIPQLLQTYARHVGRIKLLSVVSSTWFLLLLYRSQFQAASAAIKVYAAQQKIEAWQKEQDRKAAAAAVAAAAAASTTPAAGTPAGTGPAGEGAAGAPAPGGAAGEDAAAASSTQPAAAAGAGPGAGPAPAGADAGAGAGAGAGASAKAAGPSIEQLMERQKLEEAALPLMLEAMWAANVLDIQGTLKKVCKFVLTEEGVPKPVLQARAQALKMLGECRN